jgi:hypothetical protein
MATVEARWNTLERMVNENLERMLVVTSYGVSWTLSLARKTLNLPVRTHHDHNNDLCRRHRHSSQLHRCHHNSSQLRHHPRRQLRILRRQHHSQRDLYCRKRRQLHQNRRELSCRKKRQLHHHLRGFDLFYHMRRLMRNWKLQQDSRLKNGWQVLRKLQLLRSLLKT